MKFPLAWLLLAICLTSCGEPRRYGDENGIPVTIQVQVERPFFTSMENRQGRPSAGVGFGHSSRGHSYSGVGVGLSFSSTQVYIVGGDGVGQSNVFRQEVKWGSNTFTVPLAPGRTLHLSAIAEGGRRGWEALGSIMIPASAAHISITLTENGANIQVNNAAPTSDAPPAKP